MPYTSMCRGLAVLMGAALLAASGLRAEPAPYSEQGFLDAALDNCLNVEQRDRRSCECEQKLIVDRLGSEDKEMAYYYWVDKNRFAEEYRAKSSADAKWAEDFSNRFTTMQALIIAACGP